MSDEHLPEAIEQVEPGWTPRHEIDAERALRGLERLAAKFQAIQVRADTWRADIDAWEQLEVERLRTAATSMVLGLQSWARERRIISGGKEKSFRFPSGEIKTMAGRSKTEVTDEAALLAWCEAEGSVCTSAVKVTRTVLTSVLLKIDGVIEHPEDKDLPVRRVMCGGEVVPGIRILAAGESRITSEVKLASQRALPSPAASGE